MPTYNLKPLSAMVVEDSDTVRSLLGSALRSLGVGSVVLKPEGGEAIAYLEGSRSSMSRVANPPVDFVITDWVMEPVDGAMLIRWIRRHKDSPNRFMPLLMLSAHLDQQHIGEAINLGTHELLTKPFTAESLNRAVTALIDRHRLFVRTPHFFGPDRRRKRVVFKGMENRAISEAGAEGGKEAWDKAHPEIRFYRVPNALKKKVMAAARDEEPADEAALEHAQADFSRWGEDYADWARTQVGSLYAEYRQAVADADGQRQRSLMAINRIALEMTGQGATFGYPLVTSFARSLYSITRNPSAFTEKRLELVRTHIDAIALVIKRRLNDTGGAVGQEITTALENAAREIGAG